MYFPKISVRGGGTHAPHLIRAAERLGCVLASASEHSDLDVDLTVAPVSRIQSAFVVLAARSEHGQACTWMPTTVLGSSDTTITPADLPNPALLQEAALMVLAERQITGVVSVEFDADLRQISIGSGPDSSWLWTLDGAITDAYEQHLRALLNLPLGSTRMTTAAIVTMPIVVGSKPDMYHPYLHLFARDPELRVYQRSEPIPSGVVGHLALCGTDQSALLTRAEHAAEYFSGVIDE